MCLLVPTVVVRASESQYLDKRIGATDALLVADPSGNILYSKNASKRLIPASTLKILTSLVALHHLGPDFRFKTEFYQDARGNLKIKGYGDPLLISEVISDIAQTLSKRVQGYTHLILDDTYFTKPLVIPGITSSNQPYDAPNGALCVNFNTVDFKKTGQNRFISAEPQTPLLPYVLKRIKASGLKKGRIIFSHNEKEVTLYAGHLFQYFFSRAGINGNGAIQIGTVDPEADRLIYQYISRFSLEQAISKLMEHSNNFMANQILIAAGAKAMGAPGNLKKAVDLTKSYANDMLNINDLQMKEGSGISRENRVSAEMLLKALMAFKPYAHLLRYEDGIYYKTGTLFGISSRAGYMEGATDRLYPFVVILNSKAKSAARFTDLVRKIVDASE